MNTVYFILLLLVCQLYKSQRLSVDLFHDAMNSSFGQLDNVMVNKHDFVRVHDAEDKNQQLYMNEASEKDKMIVITILKDQRLKNVLSIVAGKSTDIKAFKGDLIRNGFIYSGEKILAENIIIHHYQKNNTNISVTKDPTETGAYQIISVHK